MADRDLNKLQSKFREKVDLFLVECPHVFVTEAYRTPERQKQLFREGKTYINGVDNLSMHQKGLAIDIAFRGSVLYPEDHKEWERVAKVARKHGIDWGYDLWAHTGFIDKPHFQDNVAFVMPPKLPEWAMEYVELMEERGVTTPPTQKVGDMPLYQLVGIIEKITK